MIHVVVLRNQDSIVRSLMKRQADWLQARRFFWRRARNLVHRAQGACEPLRALDEAQAHRLTEIYQQALLDHVKGSPVHVVIYEQLMNEPEVVVPDLLDRVSLDSDNPSLAVVRPELDHASRRNVTPHTRSWATRFRSAGRQLKP
jgi:hypothetical protein